MLRSRSLTRFTIRVGLLHFGQSVLLDVSITFLRSAVFAILTISFSSKSLPQPATGLCQLGQFRRSCLCFHRIPGPRTRRRCTGRANWGTLTAPTLRMATPASAKKQLLPETPTDGANLPGSTLILPWTILCPAHDRVLLSYIYRRPALAGRKPEASSDGRSRELGQHILDRICYISSSIFTGQPMR